MSALAPELILEAIRDMDDEQRRELRDLLGHSGSRRCPDLLTVRQAAEMASCSPETVRRAIRADQIPRRLVAGKFLIAFQDYESWINRGKPTQISCGTHVASRNKTGSSTCVAEALKSL